jgi:hypothetical protein
MEKQRRINDHCASVIVIVTSSGIVLFQPFRPNQRAAALGVRVPFEGRGELRGEISKEEDFILKRSAVRDGKASVSFDIG